MDPVELYRKHAVECRQMAKLLRGAESKASWNRIAERWLRCAEFEQARLTQLRRSDAVEPRRRAIYRSAS
jgi:hypothetical protein